MSEGVETVICEEICEEGEEADMAESMEKLLTAEFKEAFDEFDKVGKQREVPVCQNMSGEN